MYNIDIFIISYEEQNLFCFPRFVRFPKCFKAQRFFFRYLLLSSKKKVKQKAIYFNKSENFKGKQKNTFKMELPANFSKG